MEFATFQQAVAHFVEANGLDMPVQFRLLEMVSEVGELAKEALKATSDGRDSFHASIDWTEELGDVLFSLICLANSTRVNVEAVLEEVLEKYQRRLDDYGSIHV